MKTEAESRVMWLQAKELLEPPGDGRAQKGPPLEPSEGAQPANALIFGHLAPRTVRE